MGSIVELLVDSPGEYGYRVPVKICSGLRLVEYCYDHLQAQRNA